MNIADQKVSLVVATYNGEQYMPGLFESINNQSHQPSEVIVIDNASTDDTVLRIGQVYPDIRLYSQEVNLDFARGYNKGMSLAQYPWVLIVNQDMILDELAIEKMLHLILSQSNVAAVAPKLLRILPDGSKSQILDGLGLVGNRAHRFFNIGEGDKDNNDLTSHNVFGLSGAAIMFRRAALDSIAHTNDEDVEYFDNRFISYQEDVDLSYRFLHKGWQMMIEPQAVIYHKRTAQELKKSRGLAKDRKEKSYRVRGNSYRNHLWLLIKNEPLINLLLFSPWIAPYEMAKLVFILFVEPSTLRILPSLVKGIPNMVQKRRSILKKSKMSARELRKWFIK
ncbi:MAG: glycosyltransferase family 2 protein [Candidatus Thermoplasmatota archaeon]|nr:glycosyltransferase family 2 protein [Candidatus Thermoplasmatota archaeon]MBU1940563.1 glycosyltransferase family 2 protein [Candidatus Thermoplasmatota archaeon]